MSSAPPGPRLWRAPAKVNLTLHIAGRRADGWHELDSVVAFAGCCDILSFEPGERLDLKVEGPTAEMAGHDGDNLVLRATRELGKRVPGLRVGRFGLLKRLPVAAGLGGGSADAAAALRALADENRLDSGDPRLLAAAAATGADVPACLDPRSRWMGGIGEKLGPPLRLPPLFAVLANPRIAVATPAVFARLGLEKGASFGLQAPLAPPVGSDRTAAMIALREGRNDMQPAACALAPAISGVVQALAALSGAQLARMSGSGATCFAIFEDCRTAARGARALRRDHPDWWVKSTVLR